MLNRLLNSPRPAEEAPAEIVLPKPRFRAGSALPLVPESGWYNAKLEKWGPLTLPAGEGVRWLFRVGINNFQAAELLPWETGLTLADDNHLGILLRALDYPADQIEALDPDDLLGLSCRAQVDLIRRQPFGDYGPVFTALRLLSSDGYILRERRRAVTELERQAMEPPAWSGKRAYGTLRT